jgi:hypothetical protein
MTPSAIEAVPALGGGGGAVSSVAGRTGAVVIAESDVGSLVSDLALKAPLASPTFTGIVTLPSGLVLPSGVVIPTDAVATTQAGSDSSSKVATTAQVQAAIAASVGAVGGLPKVIIRTADSATISSQGTPQSDDTLLWAVGASDRWWFEGFLTFTAVSGGGAATTEDVKIGFSVPTGGAMQWGQLGGNSGSFAAYGAAATATSPTAVAGAAGTISVGAAAVSFGVSIGGFYTGDGSHAGNVNLQWSQAVSDASTLLIAKNSMLSVRRLA